MDMIYGLWSMYCVLSLYPVLDKILITGHIEGPPCPPLPKSLTTSYIDSVYVQYYCLKSISMRLSFK